MCINMKLSTNWNLLEGGTIQYACTKSLACSADVFGQRAIGIGFIRSIHSNSKWTIASGVIYDVSGAGAVRGRARAGRSPRTVFRGFVRLV